MVSTDVVVVGCGPTGVVLASLLGQLGVSVVVLEREAEVHPTPRATHLDEETLRNFQLTGLLPELERHTAPFGVAEVVDETGEVLFGDDVVDRECVHAFEGSRFFDQVGFEKALRRGLERFPGVKLHTGVSVKSLEPTPSHVVVHATRANGEPLDLQAAWVVGCDGGKSLCREVMNSGMDSIAPRRPWLIVDTRLRNAEAGKALPDRFRYLLERERLTIYAHGIGLNRRWEFQLEEGEILGEPMPTRDARTGVLLYEATEGGKPEA